MVQRKTERPVQFELLGAARTSILAWLGQRDGTLGDASGIAEISIQRLSATRYHHGRLRQTVFRASARPLPIIRPSSPGRSLYSRIVR